MIIEGGIVSYDTNIRTGGIGVRYLGIGNDTQYQEDVVTISIRSF
jgi:curli production assembly/transport component CsgG